MVKITTGFPEMGKNICTLLVVLLMSVSPGFADNTKLYDEKIGALGNCVASGSKLVPAYKTRVRQTCFQVAFEVCSAKSNPTECLVNSASLIGKWTDILVERLPTIAGDSPFQKTHYTKKLKEINGDHPSAGACLSSEEYEVAICKMRDASLRLLNAYHLADLASVFE